MIEFPSCPRRYLQKCRAGTAELWTHHHQPSLLKNRKVVFLAFAMAEWVLIACGMINLCTEWMIAPHLLHLSEHYQSEEFIILRENKKEENTSNVRSAKRKAHNWERLWGNIKAGEVVFFKEMLHSNSRREKNYLPLLASCVFFLFDALLRYWSAYIQENRKDFCSALNITILKKVSG